jgi:nucleotide-binding universal stress UspA family protein
MLVAVRAIQARRVGLFDRLVCAVDSSPVSQAAVRHARAFVSPLGTIDFVSAVHVPISLGTYGAPAILRDAEQRASCAVESAAEGCVRARTAVAHGALADAVLGEIKATGATLAVVPAHRGSRLDRLIPRLLRRAPCGLLVVRETDAAIPRSIVVGDDGSASAAGAVAAARHLAERLEVRLHILHALGGDVVGERPAADALLETDDRDPVSALLSRSRETDLIVVGSRGLHGIHTLGSVSERVARHAQCSVLVVR